MKLYEIAFTACCMLLSLLPFPSFANTAVPFSDQGVFTAGIEGPATDHKGNLYVVNFSHQGSIGIINSLGQARLFIDLPKGSVGNGIRFDQGGNMYVADYTGHNILRIEPESKQIEVYNYEPKMNQPNDIAITSQGVIYASDPNWKNNSGQIWLIKPNSAAILLETDMGTTNGIEVSADEKHLFVNESVQRKVWIYDILPDNKLRNKRLFYQFNDFGLDGMRSDSQGSLYIARYAAGTVAILSKKGQLLEEIKLTGQFPTNLAFGGEQGTQVFVTLQKQGSIDTFKAKYPGRSFTLLRNIQ
jgi:gluconolactonase